MSRYLRSWRQHPSFAALSVFTLTLAVGANLAVFAIGAGIGIVLGVSAGRALEASLVGVTAFDAPVYIIAACLVLGGGGLAALTAARRIAALSPLRALRTE